MCEPFIFPKEKEDGKSQWKIFYKIKSIGLECYRDYALMKRSDLLIDDRNTVAVIGLNPGTFKDKASFPSDYTLRIIREIFGKFPFNVQSFTKFFPSKICPRVRQPAHRAGKFSELEKIWEKSGKFLEF